MRIILYPKVFYDYLYKKKDLKNKFSDMETEPIVKNIINQTIILIHKICLKPLL